jgi:hypothetical protein
MDVENKETTSKKEQQQVESTKRRFEQATVDRVCHQEVQSSPRRLGDEQQELVMMNK